MRSTLDLDLQSIAENVIARRLKAEGRAKKVGQAALVALAPDGAILAMVGGRDYSESQFNRVDPGQAAARLAVQGVRLSRRLPEGRRPADDRGRSTGADRQLGAGELRRVASAARMTLRSAFANSDQLGCGSACRCGRNPVRHRHRTQAGRAIGIACRS